ncbi:hypothetical protein AAG906_037515 [Vitis piasezkii]
MKAEEWALLDRQVLGVIRLTLSRSVAHNVVKEKNTSDLMKALSGMYEKLSENNKVHLMKKLFNLKMTENASETMRMAVSNSTGKENLKYNDIRDLILVEEIRRRDADETSGSGSALNLETRDRGNDRNSNQGRSKSINSNRKISKSRSGQQIQCWDCGKTSHFRRQCKSPKKKNEDDSTNVVTKEVHDALLLAMSTSFHSTSHRETIQNYAAGDFGKVYLAYGSALDVMGLGDVRILLPNGNLIYVGQLDDEGHAILFVGGTWKVTKGARVLARGKKTNTLYMTSCLRDTIVVADASELLENWRTIKVEKLELVHTDLWGPSLVASLEVQEYINGRFCEHCAAQGIRMEKTIPRTPQQNGVVERMNRTLNERARSMRLHAGLPKTFWADVVSTAAYLMNRGPSIPMEFKLPKEVWSLNFMQSLKYVFIDYGDEKFGYRIWDEQNRKSLEVEMSTVVSDVTEIDQKKSEFVNLDELTENENSSKWELVMKDEMDSLLENQTWELTELPVGKKALHNKWLDVKTTFLHGDLDEDLYMIQPKRFISYDNSYIILLLYVDDILIVRYGIEKINNLKKQLSKQFAMKDLGAAKQILGMRIIRDKANEFNMNEAKSVSTLLGSHFKLSKEESLKIEVKGTI